MRNRTSAFTLIEALCVIVILTLTAALLFVVLGPARAKSKESVCLSNMRQLHLAVSIYRKDYDGVDPVEGTTTSFQKLGTPCSADSYI